VGTTKKEKEPNFEYDSEAGRWTARGRAVVHWVAADESFVKLSAPRLMLSGYSRSASKISARGLKVWIWWHSSCDST
jgi:hypothetical protein